MPPTTGLYSIWGNEDYDSPDLFLDCFLPSGFLIQMKVQKDATILSIKKDLWKEAKKYPFYKLLEGIESYIFMCIDETANKVEITDENRRLCDVRPFYPVLKLVRQVVRANEERIINAQISVVMGKDLKELEDIQDCEVIEFRRKMRKMCKEIMNEKGSQGWLELAMCYYPPELAISSELPKHLQLTLEKNKNMLHVSVRLESPDVLKASKFPISHDSPPKVLVTMVLDKFSRDVFGSPDEFILKVVGLQEYLISNCPLSQFVHVRNAIARGQSPELVLVHKNSVNIPKASPPCLINHEEVKPPEPFGGTNIFQLTEKFSLVLKSIYNVENISFVVVRACIYHGGENMCGVVVSREKLVHNSENSVCTFNEVCTFDIELQNIPRMARLCFLLYSHSDRKAPKKNPGDPGSKRVIKKKDMNPIAWVNIPLFDYRGMLRVGDYKLMMWPVTDDDVLTDELLNPIGTVEMNTQTDEAVCLSVQFKKYTSDGLVYYPQFDKVLEVAAQSMDHRNSVFTEGPEEKIKELKKLIERDPLHAMCEQDKELMWSLREDCRYQFPQSLPKLLTCVKWNNYIEVACMQSLLQIWPSLEMTDALELLDFQYADQSVRNFAVLCISKMSDSDLCQYLLQLVQVLKYESYLDCELISFLLRRALNNNKIGHYLFWLLRSEMHVPSVSVRFGLILEAYCRGNINLLAELNKEVEALNNLRQLNDHIKVCGFSNEKLREEVKKGLEKKCKQALSFLCCPLNPSIKLKAVKIDRCKCMDSKMKPLWLVWENVDHFGKDMLLMYKKGDDLRQDMLTLQILKIMDYIWQSAGLDLRMNVYSVLPTSQNEGLIEVVTDSKTLANIQLEFADWTVTSSFNKRCIYQWLQKQNPDPASFEKALNEFTLSCAGYSVATFVLGVADRHSDNIMIRNDGQLFHIDFGHILGNFKSKLGVKRERCPFVLTADFVFVIKKGQDRNDSFFKQFQKLCEDAFCILRQHSKFLITLFMMMMNTGIPEVSCLKDIEYLKETLVPHKTDQEAIEHFRSKFTEALKNSWKTSLNHMCHNVKVGKNQPVPQSAKMN